MAEQQRLSATGGAARFFLDAAADAATLRQQNKALLHLLETCVAFMQEQEQPGWQKVIEQSCTLISEVRDI